MIKRNTCVLAVLLTGWISSAQADLPIPTPPKFLIGVWYQPASNFDKWKARGINTLVGCPLGAEGVSREQWMDAARKAGFFYIVKPTDDPEDLKKDLVDPNLLAWEQPDEPDGAGDLPPEKIIANYKAWKAAGDKPIFLNVDGWKTQYRPTADYLQYFQGADWIGFDYYVINRGEGPGNIARLGERLDKIKLWTGGKKKIYVFIESSDQDLKITDWAATPDATGKPIGTKMRGPTADEMKREIEVSVAHGAAGIIYFPDVIGKGWENFDGTTPECEAMMKDLNAKLTATAEKLSPSKSPTGPRTDGGRDKPADPKAPLDGREMTIDGVTYILKRKP